MYTKESYRAILAHEVRMFGGDSEWRYDSREEFHKAHQPPEPKEPPTMRVYGKVTQEPDGRWRFTSIPPKGGKNGKQE